MAKAMKFKGAVGRGGKVAVAAADEKGPKKGKLKKKPMPMLAKPLPMAPRRPDMGALAAFTPRY